MQIEDLIAGLKHSKPEVRTRYAWMIGTVEEVTALPELTQAYKLEQETTVRVAFMWAGKRLRQAESNGYDTQNALFKHFGIDRAIRNLMTSEKDRLLNIMREATAGQQDDSEDRILVALMGSRYESSLLDQMAQDYFGLPYRPPPRPSQHDIRPLIQKLDAESREDRQQALADLVGINNIRALPHVARVFKQDRDALVRDQAQNVARTLYFNALCWQMHIDGSIVDAIDDQRETYSVKPETDKLTAPDDIDAILKQAQKAREKRRRR
jgi:hypothetical protein